MVSGASQRPDLVQESDLARLVRTLLRTLKTHLLENTSISVSVDYDDTVADGLDIVAMSKLPSLVLSGPRLAEDRFYSTNVPRKESQAGSDEVLRWGPSFTVDLLFTITVASDRTVELLNLMAAVATFLNRNRWIEMNRNPEDPAVGKVRWEMDPDGDFRARLDGKDDVRAFTCGLMIRGFDVDEGLRLAPGKLALEIEVGTEPFNDGETP